MKSATGAGLARLVYLLQLLWSDDELYYIVDVGLWGIGEITAGFLIMGIPGLPKVAQSIMSTPSLVYLISHLRGTTKESGSGPSLSEPKKRHPSLRTWGQGSRRQRRSLWDIGDTDTYALVTVQADAAFQKHGQEQPPNAILREIRVDVELGWQPEPCVDGGTGSSQKTSASLLPRS